MRVLGSAAARRAAPALVALGLAAAPADPAVLAWTLPSGLRCFLVEDHQRPVVRAELSVAWPASALGGRAWEPALLAQALAAGGAGPRTRVQVQQALADHGVASAFASGARGFRWRMVCDSRAQEAAFDLLAQAVLRPALDAAVLDRLRERLAREEAAAGRQERAEALHRQALGDPASPAASDLAGMDGAALEALERRLLRPDQAILILHGDLSLAQAKQLAHLHFGLWRGAAGAAPAGTLPAPAPGTLAVLDDRAEPELQLALAGWDPDPAAEALLPILLARPRADLPGAVTLIPDLAPGGAAFRLRGPRVARIDLLPALQALLSGLRAGFTEAEVARAQRLWLAERAALPLHPEAWVQALEADQRKPGRADAVAAATPASLRAELQRLFAPVRLRLLLLGADEPLAQAFAQAGFGPVTQVN